MFWNNKQSSIAPCPFCGGGVSVMINFEADEAMFVVCNNCATAVFFSDQPKTIEQIKQKWNYREREVSLKARIAKLEKEIKK